MSTVMRCLIICCLTIFFFGGGIVAETNRNGTVCAANQPVKIRPKQPAEKLLIDRALRVKLNSGIEAEWEKVPLRRILRRITGSMKIAILLDRRIDPSLQPVISLKKESLKSGIAVIAKKVSAEITQVGNTVYIGPAKTVAALPKLIQTRTAEYQKIRRTLSKTRRAVLDKERTLHWHDLDTPKKIIAQIGKTYDIKIIGLEKIPHDLWAGSTLPSATFTEQLSALLIQYNLTFQWSPRPGPPRTIEVKIVPLKK